MNEAKAKADELQRQLNDSNAQRARAQTESGKVPPLRRLRPSS